MVDTLVALGSLRLRNPILSASGTFGHGAEMESFSPATELGGLVSKTVTLRPRPGNPAPRICETEAGLLNSIGLENRGVDHYLEAVLPAMAKIDTAVIANVGGEGTLEFAEVVRRLTEREEIDAFEVNLSCPNVQGGKLPFATDPSIVEGIIDSVRRVTDKPVFAKLSPNVTRISELAVAAETGGADAVTAVNTLLGMRIDWRSGRPGLATTVGGYSGVGIKPVALRCAFECASAVSIPVIGCGGISSADDVLEFLAAGCRAVEIGTASFSDPAFLGGLAGEVATLLERAGFDSIEQVIGNVTGFTAAGR
jgi:dihydroorotate dehydrogenase (NAD+) catalytic subunit